MNMTNHTQQPELGSQHVIFAAKFARTGEFSADPTPFPYRRASRALGGSQRLAATCTAEALAGHRVVIETYGIINHI
jgi:hypothetical protein